MKATELINLLQELVDDEGDMNVVYLDDRYGRCSVEVVEKTLGIKQVVIA